MYLNKFKYVIYAHYKKQRIGQHYQLQSPYLRVLSLTLFCTDSGTDYKEEPEGSGKKNSNLFSFLYRPLNVSRHNFTLV